MGSAAAVRLLPMGLGCVLFLWAIAAAIGLAVAVIGATVFVRATISRSRRGMLAGGLLGVTGAAVATGTLAFIAGWVVWGTRPHQTTSRDAFEDAFGVAAGAEVTEIRSRTSGSTDSHEQFLRFHAPPQTVAAIVRTRFERTSAHDCRQLLPRWTDEAPAWWAPSSPPRAECYKADPFDQRLAANAAWLLYDRSTGEAHFYYSGVD